MSHNLSVGSFGEDLAEDFLKKKGYKIIERNLKISFRELDIVARKKGITVFVEVKTRTSKKMGSADEMMSDNKIRNIKRAGLSYIIKNKLNSAKVRFDFLAIDIDRTKKIAKIKHFKDIV